MYTVKNATLFGESEVTGIYIIMIWLYTLEPPHRSHSKSMLEAKVRRISSINM